LSESHKAGQEVIIANKIFAVSAFL